MAIKDLATAAAQFLLLVIFSLSGAMKVLYVLGYAPAAYVAIAQETWPLFAKSVYVVMSRIPMTPFFLLAGLIEVAGAIALFVKPKIAACIFSFTMLAVELITRSAPGYTSPMCVPAAASCAGTLGFHLFLVALSAWVYMNGKPLCKQCAMTGILGSSGRSPRATKNPYASRNRSKND